VAWSGAGGAVYCSGLFPHLGVGERKQMIDFVFILFVLMPSGELDVKSDVVATCPDKDVIEVTMNASQASGEILGWTAACITVDKNQMIGAKAS